jgi:hypothetical protein
MSRNVLDAGPHTYLDDLESFYYVLCWILVVYERPRAWMAELPELISSWDEPGSSNIKQGLLNHDFNFSVAPWFGGSLRRLIGRLHRFFRFRFELLQKPLSSLDPAKDYDEFLSHIRQGIAEMDEEPEPVEHVSPSPKKETLKLSEHTLNPPTASQDRGQGRDAGEQSESKLTQDPSALPELELSKPPDPKPSSRKRGRVETVEEWGMSKRTRPNSTNRGA